MILKINCKKVIVFFCLCFFMASLGYAADLSFSASVNRAKVAVDKKILLSLTVEGVKNPPQPQLPKLADFDVFSAGSSSKINIINGEYSSSKTYTYVLVPRKEGKFTIDSATLVYDGKTYKTEPIVIEVVKGDDSDNKTGSENAAAESEENVSLRDNLFLELSTNKREIYLNEQLNLTFRLYRRRVNLEQIQYIPPGTKDFIEESLGEQRNYQKQINGMFYEVIEINTALFPIRTGELIIDPAKIKCNLLIKQERNQNRSSSSLDNFFGDPFFDDPFFSSYIRKQIELKSNELKIMVKSHPEINKPENFTGAVGNFKMQVMVEPKRLNKGEPVTLKIIISGYGDIKAVAFPKIKNLEDFKTYEPEIKVKTNIAQDQIYGEKIFEKVLVPKKAGILTIPKIDFPFFDPKEGSYKNQQYGPVTIEVLDVPLDERVSLPVSATSKADGLQDEKKTIELYSKDIRFIKENSGNLMPVGSFLYRQLWFIGLNFLPLLFLIFLYLYKKQEQRLKSDIGYARLRVANKVFNKKLQEAKKALKKENKELFYSLVYRAMQEYLGNKFNIPAAGITINIVDEKLKAFKIDDEILQEIEKLFEVVDMAKFGIGNFSELETKELLFKVEKVFLALDKKL